MMRQLRKEKEVGPLALILMCALMWGILHLITGISATGPSAYNSYTLQALSWLQGRLDVDNRAYLELAIYEGRYYVSFPPLPSVLLLPFAFFLSACTPDNLLVKLEALAAVLMIYKALRHAGIRQALQLFIHAVHRPAILARHRADPFDAVFPVHHEHRVNQGRGVHPRLPHHFAQHLAAPQASGPVSKIHCASFFLRVYRGGRIHYNRPAAEKQQRSGTSAYGICFRSGGRQNHKSCTRRSYGPDPPDTG